MTWHRSVVLTLLAVATVFPAAAPVPLLLGHFGGAGTDDCDGIAVGRDGSLYLACHSDSPDAPGLPAKPAPQSRDAMDAVIAKVDSRGALIWATRTGGSKWDGAGAIAVASDGSLIVAGSTSSTDFPTTPDAVQRSFGGPGRDAFVLKLDPSGKVVYSTLLGGSKNDEAIALALAGDGTIFVGGVTTSPDLAAGASTQIGPGGGPDGFVARFRPADPKSLRVVRLGGREMEQVTSLALAPNGDVVAAGYTGSSDFPAADGVQPRFGGGADAFLARLRGDHLQSATFFGGSKMDGAYAVALDASGSPILSGVSESDDLPTSAAAFQPKRRGAVDAFVAKFTPDGRRLLWSTYFGGSKSNSDQFAGGSLAVDPFGRVWLTGMTASQDLPLRNAFQPAYGGGDFDGFLAALAPDGSKLCYSSYAGGSGHDILEGLAIGHGGIYASGLTASKDLRQQGWRVQRDNGGGPYDALVIGVKMPDRSACR